MGAWGILAFENDSACDWTYELEESNGLAFLDETFEFDDEYLEVNEGTAIIAACEMLALIKGMNINKDDYPENVLEWVENNKKLKIDSIIPTAIKALERVMTNDSEVYELWEETDDFEEWKKSVNKIKTELTG